MLTPESRTSLSEIADLNQLKHELNEMPPIDVGDYVTELPPENERSRFDCSTKPRQPTFLNICPKRFKKT